MNLHCPHRHHQETACENEYSTTTTLNTMLSTVTVHFPFHPLHNRCLDVVAWPRQATSAVTVRHPYGKTLKIPRWMLQPEAARFHLSDQVDLAAGARLELEREQQRIAEKMCANMVTPRSLSKCHSVPTHLILGSRQVSGLYC